MRTKKKYEDLYPDYNNHNLHDSLEDYDRKSPIDSERNVSRHRRISSKDQTQPTFSRNKSQPEIIPEYDVTKRVPAEEIHSNKNKNLGEFGYSKYSEKYDLSKKCKYYKQLQRNDQGEKIIDEDSLEEKFQEIKRKGHRRVASANYNCAKILTKKITTKSSQKHSPRHPQNRAHKKDHSHSKSNEKHLYNNYISNKNPISLKSFKKPKSKLTSCHNTKESSIQNPKTPRKMIIIELKFEENGNLK